MKKSIKQKFPRGWDEKKIRAIIDYYDNQTDEEGAAEIERAEEIRDGQLAEYEATCARADQTMMAIPNELVPAVQRLLSRHGQSKPKARRAVKA